MASPIRGHEDMRGIPAPQIPRDSKEESARVKYINDAKHSIRNYVQDSKSRSTVADISRDFIARAQLETIENLLTWLAQSVDMTLAIKDQTQLPPFLQAIQKSTSHFPTTLQNQAKELLEKWENLNWGARPATVSDKRSKTTDESDGSDVEEDLDGHVQSSAKNKANTGDFIIHEPPLNNPIWGVDGIMYGLARKEKKGFGKLSTVINPDYSTFKRNSKVYGHNGLEVGQWFPFQLSALFHGAHGAAQGGISGATDLGAYSIVVSDTYVGLNKDDGAVLFYSEPNSRVNEDPMNPPASTIGTKCLESSAISGKLVRVVRAESKSSDHSPEKGLRYDGLYRVIGSENAVNAKKGLYVRFKLERVDGENDKTLEECKQSPSAAQLADLKKVGDKYW